MDNDPDQVIGRYRTVVFFSGTNDTPQGAGIGDEDPTFADLEFLKALLRCLVGFVLVQILDVFAFRLGLRRFAG